MAGYVFRKTELQAHYSQEPVENGTCHWFYVRKYVYNKYRMVWIYKEEEKRKES